MKNIFRPFQDSFGTVRYLNDFQHILDKHQISPGYYGMIDQLVCAASEVFIGTELSTFSAHIVRLREDIHRKIAPNKEVYFTTKRHTGIPEKDNIWSTVTWMRSSNPVWPHAVYFREFQQFLRFDGKTED